MHQKYGWLEPVMRDTEYAACWHPERLSTDTMCASRTELLIEEWGVCK